MANLSHPIVEILALICCTPLSWFKCSIFSLVCLRGLTVKIIDLANQIKAGRLYCSQKQSADSSTTRQFNVEREQGEMEVANHLTSVNCFKIEMLNDQQLYSVMQTPPLCSSNMAFLKGERLKLHVWISYMSVCVSLQTMKLWVSSKSAILPLLCWEI